MVLWGFAFNVFWKREATSHACKWNTLDFEAADEPNPHFHGTMKRSKVTGKEEPHYPSHMRWFVHYPVSAMVTGCMLCAAFAIMCLSVSRGCVFDFVHESLSFYLSLSLSHILCVYSLIFRDTFTKSRQSMLRDWPFTPMRVQYLIPTAGAALFRSLRTL